MTFGNVPGEAADSDHEAQLRMLMRLCFMIDTAGEEILGKGAAAMMYQAGKDAGRREVVRGEVADDLEGALERVLPEGEKIWGFKRWKDPGQDDLWVEKDDVRSTWIVFRRCPLLVLARRVGTRPGGMLCQVTHGYMAGMMEDMLGAKVDMKIEHSGPLACKVLVSVKGLARAIND